MVAARGRSLRVERPPDTRAAAFAARLAAVGALSFVVGLALVVWNAGGSRHTPLTTPTRLRSRDTVASSADIDATPAVPAEGAAPTADRATEEPRPAPTTGFVVLDGDAGLPSPGDLPASDVPPAESAAEADVPTATPFSGPRRVERGRVAYLRCDGVPQRPGPYPCPRDEALEAATWAVLETLPRCAEAPPGLGETDVRLELARDRPTVARLRAPRPDVPRLDGAAVLRCVAGPLSHLTTASGATRLMLAFRVSLADAAAPRSDARPAGAP